MTSERCKTFRTTRWPASIPAATSSSLTFRTMTFVAHALRGLSSVATAVTPVRGYLSMSKAGMKSAGSSILCHQHSVKSARLTHRPLS